MTPGYLLVHHVHGPAPVHVRVLAAPGPVDGIVARQPIEGAPAGLAH